MINAIRYRWLAVPTLLLALTACDGSNDDQSSADSTAQDTSTSGTAASGPLSPKSVDRTLTAPDCQGEDCATVEVHLLEFDNDPALSREVERRLVQLGNPISESGVDKDDLPDTVDAYADDFFSQSAQANDGAEAIVHYSASLEAKEVSHHDDLMILELQGYVMTGGAHGMPFSEYMVIDERTHQVVTLDDMVQQGQKPAFEAALKQSWQNWQENSDVGKTLDPINWPFSPSDNAAPLEDAMAVTYGPYALGPYAIGMPTLTIPYSDLSGILKSRFLPGATADTQESK